jgi:hypothetical protein
VQYGAGVAAAQWYHAQEDIAFGPLAVVPVEFGGDRSDGGAGGLALLRGVIGIDVGGGGGRASGKKDVVVAHAPTVVRGPG